MPDTSKTIHSQLQFAGLTDGNPLSDDDKSSIRVSVDAALEAFYTKLADVPDLAHLFSGNDHTQSVKGKQTAHWYELLDSDLVETYTKRASRIGKAHQNIKLSADWYCAGYAVIVDELVRHSIAQATASVKPSRFNAEPLTEQLSFILRAAVLDIGSSVNEYFVALEQKRNLAEAAKEEQRRAQDDALKEFSNYLKSLAQRNLSKPMDAELPGDFAAMSSNLNSAVNVISRTLALADDSSATLLEASSLMANDMSTLTQQSSRASANLEESAVAMNDVAEMLSKSTKDVGRAVQFSEEAQKFTSDTQGIVTDAVDAMSSIESASSEVVEIVSLIDDVSFQTNLLALNASVEAARAGEAGRGFAVVADEVRTLSKKCAEAAQDIRQKVTASADLIQSGGNLVRQVGSALQEISQRFSDVNETIAGVANRTIEQSERVSEITKSVHNIDVIAQENASLVEKTNRNAELLKKDMTILREKLALFDLPDDLVAQVASEAGMELSIAS